MIDNVNKGYYFNSAQELKRGLSRWMMCYIIYGVMRHRVRPTISDYYDYGKYGSIYSTDEITENKLKLCVVI